MLRRIANAIRLLLTSPSAFIERTKKFLQTDEAHSDHEAVRFLLEEVSDLRAIVRHLAADSATYAARIDQTYQSFDYQWRELNESVALLSDDAFKRTATELVCELSGRPADWFRGLRVLDAGCGSGRFSWTLASLGATVTSIDQSIGGVEQTRVACKEFGDQVRVLQHDLLQPIPLDEEFDLVWSYGVLHHTGDTYRAFQHVVSRVRPGGHLFMMIYGEPRPGVADDYRGLAEYHRLRRLAYGLPMSERLEMIRREKPGEDVHGWFDAISPTINDTYTFAELRGWLVAAGFDQVERTVDQINHNVIARRRPAADA